MQGAINVRKHLMRVFEAGESQAENKNSFILEPMIYFNGDTNKMEVAHQIMITQLPVTAKKALGLGGKDSWSEVSRKLENTVRNITARETNARCDIENTLSGIRVTVKHSINNPIIPQHNKTINELKEMSTGLGKAMKQNMMEKMKPPKREIPR